MRSAVVISVVAILVVASLGAGYLAGNVDRNTVTVTSVSTSTLTSRQTVTSTPTSTLSMGQPIPFSNVETANIAIGGVPYALAANPNASRVYVAGGSSLAVIDASTNSVIANIKLPGISGGIAIDSSTDTVYVGFQGGVAEINGSTDSVVGELPFGIGYLAYDPDTHVLWGAEGLTYYNTPPPGSPVSSLVEVDVLTGSIVANLSLDFSAFQIAVDPYTNMVAAVGCSPQPVLACGSVAAIVNGTSGTVVTTVALGYGDTPTMTLDPATDVVYVSESQLVALNGTNGHVIFSSNSQPCGGLVDAAVIPSSNQVLDLPANYSYLLVYDGTSGALVNMYALPSPALFVAFDSGTGQIYVAAPGELLAFHSSATTGYANATLIESQGCGVF